MSGTGIGFLELVIPDVGQIAHGGVEAVTPILWLIILTLSLAVVGVAVRRTVRAVALIREAAQVIGSSLSVGDLGARRAELAGKAAGATGDVRNAWADFDGTLVTTGSRVHASVPAESFFTEQRFGAGLIGNRILSATPTILTTLGLFGTFLGLTVGLRELNLGSSPKSCASAFRHSSAQRSWIRRGGGPLKSCASPVTSRRRNSEPRGVHSPSTWRGSTQTSLNRSSAFRGTPSGAGKEPSTDSVPISSKPFVQLSPKERK